MPLQASYSEYASPVHLPRGGRTYELDSFCRSVGDGLAAGLNDSASCLFQFFGLLTSRRFTLAIVNIRLFERQVASVYVR
jgi:hypothetical protein